jgi:hypothetical protein
MQCWPQLGDNTLPGKPAAAMPERPQPIQPSPPEDGTTQLLRWGSLILALGAVAIGLLMTLLGGVGVEGAKSNTGWLALILGAMCLPFGLMLTVLGIAKWLRNRGLRRRR